MGNFCWSLLDQKAEVVESLLQDSQNLAARGTQEAKAPQLRFVPFLQSFRVNL